jgi:hypothetical protein
VTQKPSVGRIVHYRAYGTPGGEYLPECRAAIITAVEDPSPDAPWLEPVSLAVLNPTGMFFNQGCKHDEAVLDSGQRGAGGTWHWPGRVEPPAEFSSGSAAVPS